MTTKIKEELDKALRNIILLAIKEEIEQDPEGIGYAGNSNEEIAGLINEPLEKIEHKKIQKMSIMEQAYNAAKEIETVPVLSSIDNSGKPVLSKLNINEKVTELIDTEIKTDPENRGYAGKTKEEQKKMLSEPYEVTVDDTKIVPPRINSIFIGIPFAPNAITPEDVIEAKALK